MPHLRLLIVALATICVMALVGFALVAPAQEDPGDVMIIKGGPLRIECGKNHGTDCLGMNKDKGRYEHKQGDKHITRLVVKNSDGSIILSTSGGFFDPDHQPQIQITYEEAKPAAETSPNDIIIIKGGSLQIWCGKSHGTDCLGTNDNRGQYKHKQGNKHITRIVVNQYDGAIFFNASAANHPDQIEITYKETAAKASRRLPVVSASPLPIFSEPTSPDYDTDQFSTFDALPRDVQEKTLTERGPRLPKQYNVSDLSIRVFVAAGWPAVLDYELNSDSPAVLSIAVEGASAPLIMTLQPTERTQLPILIPAGFSAEPRVGKLQITAFDIHDRPAKFHLYGIAMGERGVQALRRLPFSHGEQLALNRVHPGPNSNYKSHDLFSLNSPQTGSTLQITVNPPTTINPTETPRKVISFSFKSRSDFSNGRWEVWRVRGLDWKPVWNKTTGSISANQTKSQTWDGMGDQTISLGDHALQLTAWHGRESDRSWVVARAAPTLVVIK